MDLISIIENNQGRN